MEITIDFEEVRRILRDEQRHVLEETRSRGALRAFALSQARHDQRLIGTADAASLACTEGCSYCCHFRVDVRTVEVFRILDFVEQHFSSEQRGDLAKALRSRAELIAAMSQEEHAATNLQCVFLSDGRCSIYPVRPQTCRNYHATDVKGCRQTFDDPANEHIDPDYAPGVYQAGAAHVDGVSIAMKQLGLSVEVCEINTALLAVWPRLEEARAAFVNGHPVLPSDLAFEPVNEFADLVE